MGKYFDDEAMDLLDDLLDDEYWYNDYLLNLQMFEQCASQDC